MQERRRHRGRKDCEKIITVGIAGNPNAGKTTIFNAITGAHQKVGNYPGVTVEKKEGLRIFNGHTLHIFDLPGTYSLTAYSMDEIVARDFLINECPDIIINIIDSTNIERNLYLTLQLQELGVPIVAALNMTDEAEEKGITIDAQQLSKIIGIPIVRTSGRNETGIDELLKLTVSTVMSQEREGEPIFLTNYGFEIEKEITKVAAILHTDERFVARYSLHWFAVKLLEKDPRAHEIVKEHSHTDAVKKQIQESIHWLEKHFGRDMELVVSEQRYGYIRGAIMETVKKPPRKLTTTDKTDRWLLNRALGLPLFFVIVWMIFQITFVVGAYPMQWMESLFEWLGGIVSANLAQGFWQSLIVDGIVGGVGGMLVFLPNIVLLFLGIALLEDSGYMARAAFIMDKILHRFGLHGQSFIPLMAGFGCTVPAILATRILKSPKDRIITILVAPLISCGARLPVYALFIGAFFPKQMSGNVLFVLYALGIMMALIMALVFRKMLFKGESSPFVMELPPYRIPTLNGVWWHIWSKTKSYLKKAGTIILAASLIIWIITTFPSPHISDDVYTKEGAIYRQSLSRDIIRNEMTIGSDIITDETIDKEINSRVAHYVEMRKKHDMIQASIAGRIGHFIEPVLRPLGFDWKIGIALVTGIAAKEIVVSTLGILYRTSDDAEKNVSLRGALQKDPQFDPLKAFVLMVFVLLYVPCLSALAVVRSELRSWKWAGFVLTYTIVLAWLMSFAVYRIGLLFGA